MCFIHFCRSHAIAAFAAPPDPSIQAFFQVISSPSSSQMGQITPSISVLYAIMFPLSSFARVFTAPAICALVSTCHFSSKNLKTSSL